MKTADHTLASVEQLTEFDCIIDVRSPAEFAEDHVPGAINCPALDNEERVRVGTLYKQVSPFEARKLGATLVARNIARHIEENFLDRPKSWRPLVYCWRGGQRSGAFTHVLREIGWPARRLQGGYKTWRHHVLERLEALPARFRFLVLAGPTGCGKSRLLEAMARQGAQVLHLEALAAHKGSILGGLPDEPQPSQKQFETRLHAALAAFDAARPVYVEAESRRIGRLTLPNALHAAIAVAAAIRLEADVDTRVRFLLDDYAYLRDGAELPRQLERFRPLVGRETLAGWQALAESGEHAALVADLLVRHYDPLYARSTRRPAESASFPAFPAGRENDWSGEVQAAELLARWGK